MKKVLFIFILFLSFGLVSCTKTTDNKPDDTDKTDNTDIEKEKKDIVITIDKKALELNIGDEYTINPSITDNLEYTLETNSDIITITNNKITAVKAGDAVVTITVKATEDYKENKSLNITIKVKEDEVVKTHLDEDELNDAFSSLINSYKESLALDAYVKLDGTILKVQYELSKAGEIKKLLYTFDRTESFNHIYVRGGLVYTNTNDETNYETLNSSLEYALKDTINKNLFDYLQDLLNKIDLSKVQFKEEKDGFSYYEGSIYKLAISFNDDLSFSKFIVINGLKEMEFDLGSIGLTTVSISYPDDLATYGQ